jgi:hypothetical protein
VDVLVAAVDSVVASVCVDVSVTLASAVSVPILVTVTKPVAVAATVEVLGRTPPVMRHEHALLSRLAPKVIAPTGGSMLRFSTGPREKDDVVEVVVTVVMLRSVTVLGWVTVAVSITVDVCVVVTTPAVMVVCVSLFSDVSKTISQ